MTNDSKPVVPPAESLPEPEPMTPETTAAEDKQDSLKIESFKTPEQVAASDGDLAADLPSPAEDNTDNGDGDAPTKNAATRTSSTATKGSAVWYSKLALHWPPHKKEYIVLAVVLVLLIGGASAAALHKPAKQTAVASAPIIKKPTPKPAPKVTTVASNLSGLSIDPVANSRPVTAVMIENSDDARPQAGLSQAGVVFEAVAEGGVTRFMALFQDQQPTNVGPIRSARPYYIAWALGFDAGYAHVGGSPDALADIKSWNVRDLDQFANGGSYHRITTREAPHNVYTGIDTLTALEVAKGYTSSSFTSFARKAEAPTKVAPTAKSINVSISGPDYDAHYDYVASSNSYNRSEAGTPQTDSNTSQQLSPKVVITMLVPKGQGALDASGAYYSDYNVLGSGPATIFQDGTVTTGTWNKASNTAQVSFTDTAGKPIDLNPGQTWITAISSPSNLSYTP